MKERDKQIDDQSSFYDTLNVETRTETTQNPQYDIPKSNVSFSNNEKETGLSGKGLNVKTDKCEDDSNGNLPENVSAYENIPIQRPQIENCIDDYEIP